MRLVRKRPTHDAALNLCPRRPLQELGLRATQRTLQFSAERIRLMNSMLHRVQCVTRRQHIPPVPVEAAPDEADCVMLRGYCMSQDEIGASEHAVPLQHDTLMAV